MSQQKVDAYKAQKAKRKAEVENNRKKKKLNATIAKICGAVVAGVVVVALVITGINSVKSYNNSKPVYQVENFGVFDYSGVLSDSGETAESTEGEEPETTQAE